MDKNLPNGWIREPLGEVVNHQKGKLPKSFSDREKKGYLPYIDIEAFEEGKIKRYAQVDKSTVTTEKDVLVVWDGSRFGLSGLGREGVLGSTLVRLYSDIVETKYLFYFVLSKYRLINSRPRGTGTPHVEPDIFWPLDFWIAPTNEQKRIVDRIEQLFSDLDEGEALLKTAQKQLATYRQSVLKAAVTGELTKDWRKKNKKNLESGEKLLARILESRRRNWKGKGKFQEPSGPDISLLPTLPNGWVWATLPQLGEFGRGKSKHRPRNDPKLYIDGKYPFLQTGAVRASRGRIKQYDTMYNDFGLKQSKLWPIGTVCITIAANIAESGILEIDACFPDSVVGLVPHADIYGEYVEFFIRTARDNLERYAPATAQKNINLEILGKVAIPLPSTDEQKEIVDRVSQIFSQIDAFEALCVAELKRSNTLRQSILRSAFSGKLVVQDPTDEPASELLARIKSGDNLKAKVKVAARRRGRKLHSDKSEAA